MVYHSFQCVLAYKNKGPLEDNITPTIRNKIIGIEIINAMIEKNYIKEVFHILLPGGNKLMRHFN
jgi:hypothetical protein